MLSYRGGVPVEIVFDGFARNNVLYGRKNTSRSFIADRGKRVLFPTSATRVCASPRNVNNFVLSGRSSVPPHSFYNSFRSPVTVNVDFRFFDFNYK